MGTTELARPKSMQTVLAALDAAGWRYAEQWGQDTGGDTFVTIDALSPDHERKVQAPWHTRRPGVRQPVGTTLRLFSAMLKEPYRGWRDVTVKALVAAVEVQP